MVAKTPQEVDDELYRAIKRGDTVLYFDEGGRDRVPCPCRALVAEVHDVRTLTLVLVPNFDVWDSTEEERLSKLETVERDETQVRRRVGRFDRSGSSRANTWCGVH